MLFLHHLIFTYITYIYLYNIHQRCNVPYSTKTTKLNINTFCHYLSVTRLKKLIYFLGSTNNAQLTGHSLTDCSCLQLEILLFHIKHRDRGATVLSLRQTDYDTPLVMLDFRRVTLLNCTFNQNFILKIYPSYQEKKNIRIFMRFKVKSDRRYYGENLILYNYPKFSCYDKILLQN